MEGGVNFAITSENAHGVDLCLFDDPETGKARHNLRLPARTGGVWHGFVPGLGAGQVYGYRVHGPYDPANGHRFNPHKLLMDPYAKVLAGTMKWSEEVYAYPVAGEEKDLVRDDRDSAAFVPKSVVHDEYFDWEGDTHPRIPWTKTVFYETHVKGLTKQCIHVPDEDRGTYAGVASDYMIDYFKKLGVTSIELLPVHASYNDHYLEEKGLKNYWAYSNLGYFAPNTCYARGRAPGDAVREFKQMVKRLHAAGLEVIMDVVYNHTAEGNHLGPTLCFRGLDNASYYRLSPEDARFYMDYTGCGNSLNMHSPVALAFVADSLRYWVTEMHVDGFRFDLATTLGREYGPFDRHSSFFNILHQDPVLSQVKLIAEPWDVGDGGYQVGGFPALWSEWNGKYRDAVRDFWKGGDSGANDLAPRMTGSSDIFNQLGRTPRASVNFVTAHDGFTLADLVSYNEKHNEANREDNNDGDNNNHSWNCGSEGPTEDAEVLALRRRQMRNFFATLILSQGVPMISGGDEIARTQHGNNNAYCQDSEISWYSWDLTPEQEQLREFVSRLIALRQEHPQFHRPEFFHGRSMRGTGIKDLVWLNPEGQEMVEGDWQHGVVRCVGTLMNGQALDLVDEKSQPVHDATFLLLVNGHHEPITFTLPTWYAGSEKLWKVLVDTNLEEGLPENAESQSLEHYELAPRCLVLLQWLLEE